MKVARTINSYKLNNILTKLLYLICFIISFHIVQLIMQVLIFQVDIFKEQVISVTDLHTHVWYAINGVPSYSILSYMFYFVHKIYNNVLSIPILLIIIIFSTIYITGKYMFKNTYGKNFFLYMVLSLLIYIEASIYMPASGISVRYFGYMSGVWHNSTLISLKFILIIFIIFFEKFINKMNSFHQISLSDYILIGVICIFGVLFKTNFAFSLYPAILVISIIWLIQYKKQAIKPILLLFLSILPSLIVIIVQAKILFPENLGSAVTIKPLYLLMTYYNVDNYFSAIGLLVKILLLSLAFPIIVLILNIEKIKKVSIFSFVWISEIISIAQANIIVEEGPRMLHGNWGWGSLGMTYILFVISIIYLINNTKKYKSLLKYKKVGIILAYIILVINIWYGYEYLVYYLTTGSFIDSYFLELISKK